MSSADPFQRDAGAFKAVRLELMAIIECEVDGVGKSACKPRLGSPISAHCSLPRAPSRYTSARFAISWSLKDLAHQRFLLLIECAPLAA